MLPWRRRPRGVLRGRPEDGWRELIARFAPGRSFVDVGCLWRVHGAYAFHAADAGATAVVGVDVNPATPEFLAENARRETPIEFRQGDLNDPGFIESLAPIDVVFCSGVLYHVPDPIWTLKQLRRLTGETLILTTAIIEERNEPQSAVLYPYLESEARQRITVRNEHRKVGVDTEFLPEKGYGNWFWGMTPSCVLAMLRLAGLRATDVRRHRFVLTVVARPDPTVEAA